LTPENIWYPYLVGHVKNRRLRRHSKQSAAMKLQQFILYFKNLFISLYLWKMYPMPTFLCSC